MPRRSRPSPTDRTHDDNWHGSYYELAIKLGPADDARLDTALKALWDVAQLGQPFRRDGSNAGVTLAALLAGHLNGVANIPGLGSTLASVILVREEVDDAGRPILGNDWLDLCLPLGALGNLDARVGAYPFDDGSDSSKWRRPIENWFAAIATAVFAATPFVHAITGEEVSGVEPSERTKGRVGVFRPDADGSLKVDPVTLWSW
ncbi:hypothetical protein [Tessaracoccus sp. ZS01]|uniref:hypothetical protein n=1 Tax=Tessaracoccus sp. ZS01 TaxID=1906324 RepID=UPI00096E58A0|nr:hypothetical protein [Tessaracoccus sp. ZS01]MCG6566903.1 hypothetical protein [Tessaracoccus sp. ZS01]OMG58034.1 hypothetical protein BJN44_04570 [Tessaracoccus sp. ZS01]